LYYIFLAQIPFYLYPFLNTISRQRAFEYLRLTSLGVIGALVKVDDPDVINFLLQTEIIPLCLRIMETGSELSKTVATFIVQKILLDDTGLAYICATAERFYAVTTVLSTMVTKLAETPSIRLLKHVVRCYLRFSEQQKSRNALKQCLPKVLQDGTFNPQLISEESLQAWLQQLLRNVSLPTTDATNFGAPQQVLPTSMVTSSQVQVGPMGGHFNLRPSSQAGPWHQQSS
jgi:CCR4-NOT transcription complex subunit 9